jgi:hypothetical protein
LKPARFWERALGRAAGVSEEARRDLEGVLRCVDPGFPRLIFALAGDMGLVGEDRALREDAILLEFAAIQLADDLADGDCDYLHEPARTGPGAHWTLQHLFYECLLRSRVSRDAIEKASRDLVSVGSAQQCEVRTRQWTAEAAERAARGLNGSQYSAYFRLLFDGTSFSEMAAPWGQAFGFALHVVTDSAGGDRRFTEPESTERLIAEARSAAGVLATSALPALREAAAYFEDSLSRFVPGAP